MKPRGTILAHTGEVRAVAFSPDGRIVATASAVEKDDRVNGRRVILGGEARLWHASNGQPIGLPMAHPHPVWSLAFSPGGRLLITGSEDGLSRLFSVGTGRQLGRPLPSDGTVNSVGIHRRWGMTGRSPHIECRGETTARQLEFGTFPKNRPSGVLSYRKGIFTPWPSVQAADFCSLVVKKWHGSGTSPVKSQLWIRSLTRGR